MIAKTALYSAGSYFSDNELARIITISSMSYDIIINGIIVDKIETVSNSLSTPKSIWNSVTASIYSDRKEVLSWLNNNREHICPSFIPATAYLNGEAPYSMFVFDAFWHTLLVGIDEKLNYSDVHKRDGLKLFDAFLTLFLRTLGSQNDDR